MEGNIVGVQMGSDTTVRIFVRMLEVFTYVTCNIWGWLYLYGTEEMAYLEGRFTTDKYIEILEEVTIPSVRAMALSNPERKRYVQER